jgi:Family of unknown function (DUF6491)
MRLVLVLAVVSLIASAGLCAAEEAQEPREGGDACLQYNRLWSWGVVNNQTLSIVDRAYKRFTVRVASGCVGMRSTTVSSIAIRTISNNLTCVRRGDFVQFVDPTLGRLTCAIVSVEREVPRPRVR